MANRDIAKLSQPRASHAIARARLFSRLDEDLRHPLAFVHGPPGAGKTTLVAGYLQARSREAVWYHVDADDADPATFFLYLAKLAQGRARRRAGLPLFTPEYLADLEGFSRRFFRMLFGRLPEGGLLVLDNTHSVGASSTFHSIVSWGAQEVPEGSGIVWIGRAGPSPAYARLIANDCTGEIGPHELPLTPEETHVLASEKFGLPGNASSALFARTLGWAAGVVLLAKHWQRPEPRANDAERITPESVEHYFVTEIMQMLTREEASTLMRTALLPAVSERDAVELSGDPRAGDLLQELSRGGLFVQRQSGAVPRYRHHDLFRDFLIASLRGSCSAEAWQAALRRAGDVALRSGDLESAFQLLYDAGDLGRSAAIVRENARGLLETGRFRTLLSWLDRLGPESVGRDPWLSLWRGRALMTTGVHAARTELQDAYARFALSKDLEGELMAATQIIFAYYYAYTDYAPMAQWVAVIARLMDAGIEAPDLPSEADLCTALVFAATWLGDVDEALFLARAEELLHESTLETGPKVLLGSALEDYYTIGSRMAHARRIIDRLMPLLDDPGCLPLARTYALLQIGYSRMRAGDGQGARLAWEAADQSSRDSGLTQTEFISRLFQSYLFSSEGDAAAAETCMHGLDAQVTDDQPLSGALYHIAGVLMEMARENGAAAARHARLSLLHAARLGGGFVNVAWRAHGSAALALAGEHEEAEQWVEEGLRRARGTSLECYRTNLLMSRAYSLLLQGKRVEAKPVIAEMLRLARDNDWWTYLRMLTHVKDAVLREAIAEGIELPTAQVIARKLRASPGTNPPRDWPWAVRIHAMGEFRLILNGQPLTFARKAQKRPLELLKAVIAMGGRGVSMGLLSGALWPESEADAADNALTMAMHRLRRLLGEEAAIFVREGKCFFDRGLVWVDAWVLEELLDEHAGMDRPADFGEVLSLYRGHFLERDDEQPWLLPMRRRLQSKFRRACIRAAYALEQSGRQDEAAQLYERGIEIDPLAEELYQRLIACYQARGRAADAAETYARCRQMLAVVLGTQPSPALQEMIGAPQTGGPRSVSDR